MIGVLGHQHVGEQPRPGEPALDRARRSRTLRDAVALDAGQLRAHVPDHPEAPGHVVQDLGDVLADRAHVGTALRAAAGGLVHHALARQVLGQRARAGRAFLHDCDCRTRHDRDFGLELIERKLELLDLVRKPLRGATELHALQLGDEQLQRLDLLRPGIQKRPVLAHHALERFDVFGQIVVAVAHACDCYGVVVLLQ